MSADVYSASAELQIGIREILYVSNRISKINNGILVWLGLGRPSEATNHRK
jgi:hypothetical protein